MTITQDKKKLQLPKEFNWYLIAFAICTMFILIITGYTIVMDTTLFNPIFLVVVWIPMMLIPTYKLKFEPIYFVTTHIIVILSMVYGSHIQSNINEDNFFANILKNHPQLMQQNCGCDKKNKNKLPLEKYKVVEINGERYIEGNVQGRSDILRLEYDEVTTYNYKEL